MAHNPKGKVQKTSSSVRTYHCVDLVEKKELFRKLKIFSASVVRHMCSGMSGCFMGANCMQVHFYGDVILQLHVYSV